MSLVNIYVRYTNLVCLLGLCTFAAMEKDTKLCLHQLGDTGSTHFISVCAFYSRSNMMFNANVKPNPNQLYKSLLRYILVNVKQNGVCSFSSVRFRVFELLIVEHQPR